MGIERIEILVEEPSMAAAMDALLPKILGNSVAYKLHPSQCKNDLLDNLPRILSGYSRWLPPTWRVIVVVDRDDQPCDHLKDRLESIARTAGLQTRTCSPTGGWRLANRIAIEELEAWFFGDMDAVRAGYPRVGATVEKRSRYRDPDAVAGGTWEALERVLKAAGYFRTGLRKIEAAKAIAPHMDPAHNRSRSFQVFREALLETMQP